MKPCQCECNGCLFDMHCDSATCALEYESSPKFVVGQRVIAGHNLNIPALVGYYGHITSIHSNPTWLHPLYYITLMGRVGGPVNPGLPNPCPYFEPQLEAAD